MVAETGDNELMRMGLIFWLPVCLCAQTPYDPKAPLTPETILLARIKNVMADNMLHMPNYTCTMTIERTRRTAKSKRFQAQDVLRLEVALVSGKELFAWPGSKNFEDRDVIDMVGGGAIGTGDFALHAKAILYGRSARHRYAGKEDLNGRSVQRFNYEVPQHSSGYLLRIQPEQGTVGYRGSFWADADTMDLLKLEIEIVEIPPNLPLRHGSNVIEYGRARIGSSDFLLPKSSEMTLTDITGEESKNRTTFSGCKQYSGESTLIFEDPPPEKPGSPVPEAPVTLTLPAGLDVSIKLSQPLVSSKLAVGDMFEGVVSKAVRRKGVEILPAGARVQGRVTLLTRVESREASTVLGLHPESFAFGNKSGAFHADLVLPAINYFMGPTNRLRSSLPPTFAGGFKKGTGYFIFTTEKFSIPSGFAMVWRTLEVSGDPPK